MSPLQGRVSSVALSAVHDFSKQPSESISLVEAWGVEGDAHAGTTIQHRSRVARDPSQPNLRQVHLVGIELLQSLAALDREVRPGELGENITTAGIDLVSMPVGTCLQFGQRAEVRLTGLRNPCWQIDRFQDGLLKLVTFRDRKGNPGFRGGVMAVVTRSGPVRRGDEIFVVLPDGPYVALARV